MQVHEQAKGSPQALRAGFLNSVSFWSCCLESPQGEHITLSNLLRCVKAASSASQ